MSTPAAIGTAIFVILVAIWLYAWWRLGQLRRETRRRMDRGWENQAMSEKMTPSHWPREGEMTTTRRPREGEQWPCLIVEPAPGGGWELNVIGTSLLSTGRYLLVPVDPTGETSPSS